MSTGAATAPAIQRARWDFWVAMGRGSGGATAQLRAGGPGRGSRKLTKPRIATVHHTPRGARIVFVEERLQYPPRRSMLSQTAIPESRGVGGPPQSHRGGGDRRESG